MNLEGITFNALIPSIEDLFQLTARQYLPGFIDKF